MKKLNKFKPLMKFVKEDKWRIIIATICISITALSEILTGYLMGSAVESVTSMHLKTALIYMAIYYILSLIINGIIQNVGDGILLTVESKLTRKLGYFTYVKALNLPSVAYEEKSSGEIINRITNDADSLSFTIGRIISMITDLIATSLLLIYIFINSWVIGLEIVIFISLLGIIIKKYTPKIESAHKDRKKEQDRFLLIVNESIRGIREIKTLGIKKNLLNNVKEIIASIFKVSKDEVILQKKFRIVTRVLKASLEVGVFASCIFLLYFKQINLTFFIAMTYYIYRYMWLIEETNDLVETIQNVSVSIERVNEILDNKLYDDVSFGEEKISNIQGLIEFKNVTFNYPNEDITLNKFNLQIEPNKKIAIVGSSGQGKSTLFNLITRIFDPTSGVITLDGIDIKDLSEEELRHHISIIRQEPFIFNRTIFENFKLINPHITKKEVKKYAKLAYIDDYIESLPKGYDTLLGEGGVNLSGGQKQRLAIARTLSKDAKVILFDEATSALDNNSQEYIKKAIDGLVKDHTIIIVAHRLSTIKDADIIHVVDKGKIVASGTHDELMKKSKLYKNLYKNESLNS